MKGAKVAPFELRLPVRGGNASSANCDLADRTPRSEAPLVKEAVLVRCVPQLSFDSGDPPSYFFVSGHARRLNPRGVECLYLGGDEATAGAEYDRNAAGTTAGNQPKIIFKVRAHLHGVVDLGDAYVRKRLKIRDIDLFGSPPREDRS